MIWTGRQSETNRARHRSIVIAALALVAGMSGCRSTPTAVPPADEFPSYLALAETHNARVQQLQTFYAAGVIEIRWRDAKGKHVEQGNLEMWLQLPRRTAVRVEKLGEVLLWLGSDDNQTWLFDLTAQEKTLHIGNHESALREESGGIVAVTPSALIDLMGLSPLPISEPAPPVQYDSNYDAWVVESNTSVASVRTYFERRSHFPKRIETLDDQGNVVFFSELRRFESTQMQGMSVAAFPRMPHLIDIASPPNQGTGDDWREGQVKIDLSRSQGFVSPDQLSRLFDLERLKQSLRPERIEQ